MDWKEFKNARREWIQKLDNVNKMLKLVDEAAPNEFTDENETLAAMIHGAGLALVAERRKLMEDLGERLTNVSTLEAACAEFIASKESGTE